MKKKILIADDEPMLRECLKGFLVRQGFEVYTAVNGRTVIEDLSNVNPDLILLDIMMPKLDGIETCLRIREISNVPIMFLTAKSDVADKIKGLTCGCDDYITKPFNYNELLLRINAVLRRVKQEDLNRNVIRAGSLLINKSARFVEIGGTKIELTPKEFDLLWLLANRPEQVFTRDQIIRHIWQTDYCEDTALLTTLVKRLREKIESLPESPKFIKTVRGIGYKLG